jgi:hypothetical protein
MKKIKNLLKKIVFLMSIFFLIHLNLYSGITIEIYQEDRDPGAQEYCINKEYSILVSYKADNTLPQGNYKVHAHIDNKTDLGWMPVSVSNITETIVFHVSSDKYFKNEGSYTFFIDTYSVIDDENVFFHRSSVNIAVNNHCDKEPIIVVTGISPLEGPCVEGQGKYYLVDVKNIGNGDAKGATVNVWNDQGGYDCFGEIANDGVSGYGSTDKTIEPGKKDAFDVFINGLRRQNSLVFSSTTQGQKEPQETQFNETCLCGPVEANLSIEARFTIDCDLEVILKNESDIPPGSNLSATLSVKMYYWQYCDQTGDTLKKTETRSVTLDAIKEKLFLFNTPNITIKAEITVNRNCNEVYDPDCKYCISHPTDQICFNKGAKALTVNNNNVACSCPDLSIGGVYVELEDPDDDYCMASVTVKNSGGSMKSGSSVVSKNLYNYAQDKSSDCLFFSQNESGASIPILESGESRATEYFKIPRGTYSMEIKVNPSCSNATEISCSNNFLKYAVDNCPCKACVKPTLSHEIVPNPPDNCDKLKIIAKNNSSNEESCPSKLIVETAYIAYDCADKGEDAERTKLKTYSIDVIKPGKTKSFTIDINDLPENNNGYDVYYYLEGSDSETHVPIICSNSPGFDIKNVEVFPDVITSGNSGVIYVDVWNYGEKEGKCPDIKILESLKEGTENAGNCCELDEGKKVKESTINGVTIGAGNHVILKRETGYKGNGGQILVTASFDYESGDTWSSCNYDSEGTSYTYIGICEDPSLNVSIEKDGEGCEPGKSLSALVKISNSSDGEAQNVNLKYRYSSEESECNCEKIEEKSAGEWSSIFIGSICDEEFEELLSLSSKAGASNNLELKIEYEAAYFDLADELWKVREMPDINKSINLSCDCKSPSLNLEVTPKGEKADCPHPVEYEVTVTNVGEENAKNVKLKQIIELADRCDDPDYYSYNETIISIGSLAGTGEGGEGQSVSKTFSIGRTCKSNKLSFYAFEQCPDGTEVNSTGQEDVEEPGCSCPGLHVYVTAGETDGCGGTSSACAQVALVGEDGEITPIFDFGDEENGYTLEWSNGIKNSSCIHDLVEGTYSATVKHNKTGKSASGSDDVEAGEASNINVRIFGGGEIEVCGHSKPTIYLEAKASGGCPGEKGYTYSWPDGKKEVHNSGTFSCSATDEKGNTGVGSVDVTLVDVWCSGDPNLISGPDGFGDNHFIAKNTVLPYTIMFENDPALAQAAAAKVIINLPVSPNVSISSFRLGSFGVGDTVFEVPSNSATYSQRLDLRESKGIFLDVVAGIDVINKNAFWVFQSIDPANGLPVSDPEKGFLPVNDKDLHNGEGYVSYSWKPGYNVKTGDLITAQAEIIFDLNESIKTNFHTNQVDAHPPSSGIKELPPVLNTLEIPIIFNGEDDPNGSGIQNYFLYIAENGGDFISYGQFDTTQIIYAGQLGKYYNFFSRAVDNTGNLEGMKNTDEAFVLLGEALDPALETTGINRICKGEEFELKAEYVEGWSYQWLKNSVEIKGASKHNLIATDSGSYRLLVHDITKNYGISDSVIIQWKESPEVDVIVQDNKVLCEGGSVILSTDKNFKNYSWSNGKNSRSFQTDSAGVYSVMVTGENNCTAISSLYELQKHEIPNGKLFYSNTDFCRGDSVLIGVDAVYPSYSWMNGATEKDLWINEPGDYYATLTNEYSCSANTDTIAIMEKITPSAFFTYSIEKGSKLTIRNLTQEADNYLWSFGDGETSTDENPVHEYEISFYGDTIYLTATNSESGCTDQHMEIISGGTSINDFNQNFHVSIYPNPNQGMFWISTNENMDRYDVKIFNLLGEVIYSNFNYTHDLLELNFEDSKTKGIYIIELRYKDKIYKEKLVIE